MTLAYEIKDHGVEHEQYFQGAGVAFTPFSDCATGCGSSAKAAGEDALEIFWQGADKEKVTVEDATKLEAEIATLSPEEDAHHESHHHYVTIKWRYA